MVSPPPLPQTIKVGYARPPRAHDSMMESACAGDESAIRAYLCIAHLQNSVRVIKAVTRNCILAMHLQNSVRVIKAVPRNCILENIVPSVTDP
jgi:hypothetical protein